MLSDAALTTFLKLQQMVLDIEESSKLLDQFLPKVLQELNVLGLGYIYLSAVFIDKELNTQKTFFVDITSNISEAITKEQNLFQKGSEWEMKVMYGEAAVVSDVAHMINPSYAHFSQIHSLLILPIQQKRQLMGVLILASSKNADQIHPEEIEFGQMITRLIDLGYRLEDTESSLTKITQQVYEANAKLHQLDKLKDDFVSLASHELRTPMTAIRSYAWMALHKSDTPLSEKMEKYLVRIVISTERLINLVNELLNISRIESGRVEIKPETIDMISLSKDIADEVYYSKSADKNIQILLMEQPIPKVFADPAKLREVVLNIMGNAVKFSPNGGKITVSFFTDGKTLETSIKDEGPGISKEDLGKLFQKFGRLDSTYTAAATTGGTGLGLYLSKSLIELMHGKIQVTSEGLGKGATFTFSLPVATKEVLDNAQLYTINAVGEAKGLEPTAI